MHFEGNLEVLQRLFKKKHLLERGDERHKEIRPAVLVLPGVMRGVYGGGQTAALDAFGLVNIFDIAVGISTGAPVGAFFLSGQAKTGVSVYWHECTTPEFMSWRRGFIGGHIVDVDYLASVFRGQTPRNILLDEQAIRQSRTKFYIAVTCASTGAGVFLDAKATKPDVVEAIRASISIPGISHGNVVLDGVRYMDGSIAHPLPVRWLLEKHQITDLLVLPNGTQARWERKGSIGSDIAIKFFARDYPMVRRALAGWRTRIQEELAFLRSQQSCNFAVLWGDSEVGRYERNPKKLEAAAIRSEAHFAELLSRAGL